MVGYRGMGTMVRSFAILLLVLTFLSGCAGIEDRVRMLREKYPSWNEEIIRKVAAREIGIGMTPEMVAEALGKGVPGKYHGETGDYQWGYYRFSEEGGMEEVYTVYFKDNKVIGTTGEAWMVPTW